MVQVAEYTQNGLRRTGSMRQVIKQLICTAAMLPLLAGCAGPFWDCKVVSESESLTTNNIAQEEPFRDDELVDELNQAGLNARLVSRGILVNLEDLSFELGKTKLTHKVRIKLRDIARLLTTHRAANRPIAVEGHTDSVGSESANLTLSKKRAEAVEQELILNRVQAERITVRGYGEQNPIAANTNPDGSDNPTGRAKNRRVELIIGGLEANIPENDSQQ